MNTNDWIGTIGVFLILLAYFLTATNKMSNKSIAYISLNLIGAGLAGLASYLIKYYPFVILEGVWALVSLFSLYKYFNKSVVN